jgi:hypothetical protein
MKAQLDAVIESLYIYVESTTTAVIKAIEHSLETREKATLYSIENTYIEPVYELLDNITKSKESMAIINQSVDYRTTYLTIEHIMTIFEIFLDNLTTDYHNLFSDAIDDPETAPVDTISGQLISNMLISQFISFNHYIVSRLDIM